MRHVIGENNRLWDLIKTTIWIHNPDSEYKDKNGAFQHPAHYFRCLCDKNVSTMKTDFLSRIMHESAFVICYRFGVL